MGIVLRGPGIYVPERVLTNQDLIGLVDENGQKVLDTSDEWIVSHSGIKERRISLDEDVKQIGIKAALNLQQRLGEQLRPDEIVFATNRHRDGEFPSYASYVASALGIKNGVAIHDSLAGCTGLVYAICGAFHSIKCGETQSALVGGVERLTDFTNYADRETCILFGDGAGWYKLESREGEEGIISSYRGGSPDTEGNLTIKKMDGKKLKHDGQKFVACDSEDYYLTMKGKRVYKFATGAMVEAVHKVLERTNGKYSWEDVDVIIPHGANIRIIDAAQQGLREKGFKGVIYTNLDRFANTSTASVAIADAEARERGIIKEGHLVIYVAFGAGLTSGAVLQRATLL